MTHILNLLIRLITGKKAHVMASSSSLFLPRLILLLIFSISSSSLLMLVRCFTKRQMRRDVCRKHAIRRIICLSVSWKVLYHTVLWTYPETDSISIVSVC